MLVSSRWHRAKGTRRQDNLRQNSETASCSVWSELSFRYRSSITCVPLMPSFSLRSSPIPGPQRGVRCPQRAIPPPSRIAPLRDSTGLIHTRQSLPNKSMLPRKPCPHPFPRECMFICFTPPHDLGYRRASHDVRVRRSLPAHHIRNCRTTAHPTCLCQLSTQRSFGKVCLGLVLRSPEWASLSAIHRPPAALSRCR